ncbi:hypothetical protein SCLCIDRAFT_1218180 [Scleroderma citrinum Foug A]|uniref:Uncharacterized protein n=1 Tax=Scleroderma citrinum Foug A TaxID=1036808 RepID=A0A0C3DDQ9_9AGAM|nr:hypothetical protein SCLCIDRAFT_1218180 [Scleroderma citrinum Foug A]
MMQRQALKASPEERHRPIDMCFHRGFRSGDDATTRAINTCAVGHICADSGDLQGGT